MRSLSRCPDWFFTFANIFQRCVCFVFFLLPFDWVYFPRISILDPFSIIIFLWIFFWFLEGVFRKELQSAANPLHFPLLIFLAACVLSLLFKPLSPASLVTLLHWAGYVAVAILVSDLTQKETFRKIILSGIIFSGNVAALGGIFDFFHYLEKHQGWFYRARFSFESPNLLANFLLMLLPFSFLWIRWWGGIAFLFLLSFSITFSRGALVGFFAECCFLVLSIKWNRKLLIIPAGMFLGIVIALVLFLPREALRRAVVFPFHLDLASRIRIDDWKSSLQMIKDHPISGVGVGNFSQVYSQYALPGPGSHYRFMPHAEELYLQIGAETGLTGLAAFLWLLATLARMSFETWKKSETDRERILLLAGSASILGFLGHGFFDYTLWYAKTGVLFWTIVGLNAGLWRSVMRRRG